MSKIFGLILLVLFFVFDVNAQLVSGPSSAVNSTIPIFSGTTGKKLTTTDIIVDGSDITFQGNVTADGFFGSGENLTDLDARDLINVAPYSVLSPLLSGTNIWTGTNIFDNVAIAEHLIVTTLTVTETTGIAYSKNIMAAVPNIALDFTFTNLSDNLTITGLASTSTTVKKQTTILLIGHASNTYTVTIPNSMRTPDGVKVYYITNSQVATLEISALSGTYTNAVFKNFY